MKIFNSLLILILVFTTFSCQKNNKPVVKDSTQTVSAKEDLQSIEVNIEGMTCEIGCAKLIQSKVYKLDGVKESKVNFEEKKGVFTFDKNKITSEEITKNINGIAGGDLYKVTEIKTLN